MDTPETVDFHVKSTKAGMCSEKEISISFENCIGDDADIWSVIPNRLTNSEI